MFVIADKQGVPWSPEQFLTLPKMDMVSVFGTCAICQTTYLKSETRYAGLCLSNACFLEKYGKDKQCPECRVSFRGHSRQTYCSTRCAGRQSRKKAQS